MTSKRYEKKELYAKLALKWCKNFFGINVRRKKSIVLLLSPKIMKKKRSIVYGNYDIYRNTMCIYLNNNATVLEVVQTVIHEYTHYLQSSYRYKKYEKIYYYTQNPCEIEAKHNEEAYGNKCLRYVRNQSKISNSCASLKKNNTSSG